MHVRAVETGVETMMTPNELSGERSLWQLMNLLRDLKRCEGCSKQWPTCAGLAV